ncbi:uncharacterized protein METZ01_LOCUS150060 [marine metagenome]|uniref:DNA polymerase III delta N-terminal domain-containing protein n=1 Tax=marine metagenome TaxID=408172 RepID=A0A382A6P3_9ZZZZ
MKGKEAIIAARTGTINSVYFLKGNDQFLQTYFIGKISDSFFGKDPVDKTLMLPDDMNGNEIINRLSSTDLFSSKKLFVLRNPQQLKGKPNKDLLDYCQSPMDNHVLILVNNNWLDKSAFSKKLEKILDPVEMQTPFAQDMKKWAKYFFNEEGKNVDSNVIHFLVELAGDSVAHLKNEIENLCIWAGEDDSIGIADVEMFSGWKRERQRWEFLLALGGKDFEKSVELGKTIVTTTESMISLIYPLTTLFQEMLFEKMKNGTFGKTQGYIHLPPSVKKRIPKFANGFSREELESALNQLGQIDQRQKTAYSTDETDLIQFIGHVLG